MTPQHRQRLLGFVLLISVGVIFLPMLLDGEGYRQRQMDTEIPPVPESPPWAEFEPEHEALPASPEVAAPRPQPTPDPVRSAPEPEGGDAVSLSRPPPPALPAEEAAVLDTQGVPTAWTLQLASFRDHDNASKLQARLREAGYKAYLSQKEGLTQVFVGPDIQRSTVETLRQRLKQDLGLEGLVLRFSPRS